MSLTLTVDGDRWRGHLRAFAEATPGLVPVAKGNGYGFTLGRLARKAQWLPTRLGVDTLAVGTYEELPEVAARYAGDLLVLTPWRPFGTRAERPGARRPGDPHRQPARATSPTCSTRQPDARFVLERATSMLRHGMTARGAAGSLAERRASAAAGSRGSRCTCRWPTAPPVRGASG